MPPTGTPGNDPRREPTRELPRPALIGIWSALAVSLVMYYGFIQIIPVDPRPFPALETALLGLAAVLILSSFMVKSAMLNHAAKRNIPRLKSHATIVAATMCEAAGLFGLVLHFVAGSPRSGLLMMLGLIGILLHFPQRAR